MILAISLDANDWRSSMEQTKPRTQKELIALIPLYQSGEQKGHPTNERLRELHGMLVRYTYGAHELAMLEAEVMAVIPKRTLEKRARDAAEGYNV